MSTKKHSIYLNAKELMHSEAKRLKLQSDDKPYIRYELNNLFDQMSRQFYYYAMKDTISTKQAAMYHKWLENYTCKMHP